MRTFLGALVTFLSLIMSNAHAGIIDPLSSPWLKLFGQYFCTENYTKEDKDAVRVIQDQMIGYQFEITKIVFEDGEGRTIITPRAEMPEDYYSDIPEEKLVFPFNIQVLNETEMLVNAEHTLKYNMVGCSGVDFSLYNKLADKNGSRFFGFISLTPEGFSVCEGNYLHCENKPKKDQYKHTYVFKRK